MPDALDPLEPSASGLITAQTEQWVRDIGIPPCPAVLEDFLAETRRPEPDLLRVSHLVGKDVALSAALIKTVNSPFYGLRSKARTVRDALSLLGLRRSAQLLSGLLLRNAFPKVSPAELESFWDHSAKTALITAYLARELEVADLDEGHTFGLFRDCGVPALLGKFPDYRKRIGDPIRDGGQDISAREQEHFGVDHASVGAALARSWHVDEGLWAPIAVHHGYGCAAAPEAGSPACKLVALALLADAAYRIHRGIAAPDGWEAEESFVERVLGSDSKRMEPLQNDIARILAAR